MKNRKYYKLVKGIYVNLIRIILQKKINLIRIYITQNVNNWITKYEQFRSSGLVVGELNLNVLILVVFSFCFFNLKFSMLTKYIPKENIVLKWKWRIGYILLGLVHI